MADTEEVERHESILVVSPERFLMKEEHRVTSLSKSHESTSSSICGDISICQVHVCACMCVCMYTCVCVSVRVYMHAYMCLHVCGC